VARNKLDLYASLTRVEERDDGTLYVEGVASTEDRDTQPGNLKRYGKGLLITADAMRGAIPEFMRWGNVREMHEPIAAGRAVKCEVRDDKRTYLAAHVVDENSVKKVKAGVLQGFSIGATITQRNADDETVIEGIDLNEISLVDRPAIPECVLTLVRLDQQEQPMPEQATQTTETPAPEPVVQPAAEVSRAEETQAAAPVPAAEAKPAPVEELKRYLGQEIWDAKAALEALLIVQGLLWSEQNEQHGEDAAQVADLKAAVEKLKAFIASEIVEAEPAADVTLAQDSGEVQRKLSADMQRSFGEHHAALKRIHRDIGALHRAFGESGWKPREKEEVDEEADEAEGKGKDEAKNAAESGELQRRLTEAEDVTRQAGEELQRALEAKTKLAEENAALRAQLEAKGFLKLVAVDKADDSAPQVERSEEQPTDTVSVIRRVHAAGPTRVFR
jgi:hypothetical protein